MNSDERTLYETVSKLEAAWNSGDSIAWVSLFADDADFIHVLGGFFHGAKAIEHGHRVIFDTIYKSSRNRYKVEKIRFLSPTVAVVFVVASLTWFLRGNEQHIQARPTLVVGKQPDGNWKIAVFQNTLITTEAVPTLNDTLTQTHPIKGDTAVE